jgi:hypothetical protein
VITFFVVIFILSILTTILRYVAETASIRMVDEYEQSGVKVGFRQAGATAGRGLPGGCSWQTSWCICLC